MDADVEVRVLTTTANGERELSDDVSSQEQFDGVRVRYLPLRFPRRYFNASGLAVAIRSALEEVDIAHVHGLWSFPVWVAVRECQRAGVPFVVSPRGMLDGGSFAHHRRRKQLAYWVWERRYLSKAALLHATSRGEAESLARLQLGPEIVCLPNGVAPPTTAPSDSFRGELGIDPDAPLVVFLGRLHPMKRLDLLVPAFRQARRELRRAHLAIAGPADGVDIGRLLPAATTDESVSFIGHVPPERKWALLSTADVLVSCSDSESFGMSVVEAMAVGTPVVVTKTCPWEEVAERRAGLWVEQSSRHIAEAIVDILRDRAQARAMGERGRALVAEKYRWSAIGVAMSSCYGRVLG